MFVDTREKKSFIDLTLRKKAWCCSTILDWHPTGTSTFTQGWIYLQTVLCYQGIEKFWFSVSDVIESTIDQTCSRNMK